MKSRFDQLQDPKQRRHFALLRSGAAVTLAAVLFTGAVLLPHGVTSGTQVGGEFDAALVPLSEAGDDRRLPSLPVDPRSPEEQLSNFDELHPQAYMGQSGLLG